MIEKIIYVEELKEDMTRILSAHDIQIKSVSIDYTNDGYQTGLLKVVLKGRGHQLIRVLN